MSGIRISSPLASRKRRPEASPLAIEVTARDTTMQVAAPRTPVTRAMSATPGDRSHGRAVPSEAMGVAAPAMPTAPLSSIPTMRGRSAIG
ncbi:hypothetical protein ACRAWC_22570 [Leifsonia sp. L25]|uniref:hypothetical protein n=1 Tax=Leifsonia sp. L25 TaxID=3423957 RepID=UPI003D684D12